MSEAGLLRAMVRNYSRNNLWDHLDAEACTKAANKIDELTEKVIEQETTILKLQMALADAEALETGTAERCERWRGSYKMSQEKVIEQAAVIEKLIPALRFDSLNMSLAEWRDVCKVAEVARTYSKQILADWMREQLGGA